MDDSLVVLRKDLKNEEKRKKEQEREHAVTETKIKRLEKVIRTLERPMRYARVPRGDVLAEVRIVPDDVMEKVLYVLIDAPEEGMTRVELCEKTEIDSGQMSYVLAKVIAEKKVYQTNPPNLRNTRWKLTEE